MLNKAIKLIRMYSNMKATDLAVELGITSGRLSELENGKKKIPVEILTKYGKIFKVDPSFILSFAEKLAKDKSLEKKIFEDIVKTIEGISK